MSQPLVFYVSGQSVKCLRPGGGPQNPAAAWALPTAQLSDEQISRKIESNLKLWRTKPRAPAVVLLARGLVILRHLELPSHQDSEIRSMIDLQIIGHIPYSREEVEIDFQVLEKRPDGYSKVAVVVAAKDTTARYWRLLTQAGVRIKQMTISSVGLWLLYLRQQDASSQLSAIIDLDERRGEICLCQKDRWLGSREIPVGTIDVEREGRRFLDQWEATMAAALKEQPASALGAVYTAGKTPQTGILAGLLSPQGCAVREIDLSRQLASGSSQSSFAALIGVALSPREPPLNLVPLEMRAQQGRDVYRREVRGFLVCLVFALAALGLALNMGLIADGGRAKALSGQAQAAEQKSRRVTEQSEKLKELERLWSGRFALASWLKELYRLVPPQVSLTSLNVNEEDAFFLQGWSSSPEGLDQFQKALAGSARSSNVTLESVEKRPAPGGDIIAFRISGMVRKEGDSDEKTP